MPTLLKELNTSSQAILSYWDALFLEHTTLFLLSGLCTPPCIALPLVGFLPSLTLSLNGTFSGYVLK